jgi:hypothetical protein
MAGDYAAGLDWGRRAVRQTPELVGSWRGLALSAAMLGYLDEAQEAVARDGYSLTTHWAGWTARPR